MATELRWVVMKALYDYISTMKQGTRLRGAEPLSVHATYEGATEHKKYLWRYHAIPLDTLSIVEVPYHE